MDSEANAMGIDFRKNGNGMSVPLSGYVTDKERGTLTYL